MIITRTAVVEACCHYTIGGVEADCEAPPNEVETKNRVSRVTC